MPSKDTNGVIYNDDGSVTIVESNNTFFPAKGTALCSIPEDCYGCVETCGSDYQKDNDIT